MTRRHDRYDNVSYRFVQYPVEPTWSLEEGHPRPDQQWTGDDSRYQHSSLSDYRDENHGGGRRSSGFRGRGPKGYRRSDERIREDVNECLTDDPFIDAIDIEVVVKSGEVTLSGTVPDRKTRRAAEDVAEAVAGVSYVQNNLRVQVAEQHRPIPALGRGVSGPRPAPSIASQIGSW